MKKVTRSTLARYAGMLGRNSLAADALRTYDTRKAAGDKVEIHMANNGFRLKINGTFANYGA